MTQVSRTKLRTALNELFSSGELRTLCFDLDIEYENLAGGGKSEKVVSLVRHAERHNLYERLVAYVKNARPHADLGPAKAAPPIAPVGNVPNQDTMPDLKPVTHVYVSGDYVGGDKVGGDKVGGDKTGGDKITTGDISGGTGFAIGKEASSTVTSGHTITAGGDVNIAGGDINPNPQNPAEFEETLKALKLLLEQALAEGEIDQEDGETAVSDLQDVIEETEKETPRSQRMMRRLEDISEVIGAAAKAGTAVLKATPIIAGLIKAVSIIF